MVGDDVAVGAGCGLEGGIVSCGPAEKPAIDKPQQSRAVAARAIFQLLQRITSQTAQQLRVEICGLLRQHLAAESNVAYLIDLCRVHQESHVGALPYP